MISPVDEDTSMCKIQMYLAKDLGEVICSRRGIISFEGFLTTSWDIKVSSAQNQSIEKIKDTSLLS